MFGNNVCTKKARRTRITPNFFPSLTTMQEAIDDLGSKYQLALGRGSEAIAGRNQSHQAALDLFRQGAAYVQAHCQDNLEILLSSGFSEHQVAGSLWPAGGAG